MFRLKRFLKQNNFQPISITELDGGGHGSTLSVKVVMPTKCQASCKFCFNKYTAGHQCGDKVKFLDNLNKSLDLVVKVKNRKISIDITGAEPTYDANLLLAVLEIIERKFGRFHFRVEKVVLTTNGYHLTEVIHHPLFRNIDIVNISLHRCNFEERAKVFRTYNIPNDDKLRHINAVLHERGIRTTGVAVIWEDEFKSDQEYKEFVQNFAKFLQLQNFENGRIRMDYMNPDSNMANLLFAVEFEGENVYDTPALHAKTVPLPRKVHYTNHGANPDPNSPFMINIYKGVPDIAEYVVGPELIIDDDGKLYLDYIKGKPIQPKDLRLFEDAIFVVSPDKPKYPKFTKDQRSSFPYWFWHWKAFNDTARKLGVWKFHHLFHDIEKPFLRLFMGYKSVQEIHRKHNPHHLEYPGEKNWLDMYIDWECSRLTKVSSPRNAIEEANYKLGEGSMSYEDYCKFMSVASKIVLL